MSKRKPSRQPPGSGQPGSRGNSASQSSRAHRAAPASPRRVLFRLLALTVIPVLLLGLLEIGLRMGGYGYPTHYFLKSEQNGRTVFTENHQFGQRFFPPGLGRTPHPFLMEAHKPTGALRVFVLGESAAMGDPEPAFGFGRYLEALLRERFPETRFEVVNVAMTAINSHIILPIARECAGHEGDLWVVYMGNNEVEGPFGAGTVFGPKAPALPFIRSSIALKSTRVGQLLDALQRRLRPNASGLEEWQGLKMFLDHQVRESDPAMGSVYRHFGKNLADIIDTGRNAGAKIIVSSVASNLKDCAPFTSLHAPTLSEADLASWKALYENGGALQAAKRWGESLERYGQAAQIDASFAELQFRIGQCQLALSRPGPARQAFERARDLDTLRFRADSRLNQIIRETTTRPSRGDVRWVDAAETLARGSTNDLPGNELFFDHVHLNPAGNYLVARTIADQALELLPKNVIRAGKPDWASAEVCDRRLALTDWNRLQIYDRMRRRMLDAPFTNQLSHAARSQFYQERLGQLKAGLNPQAQQQTQQTYLEALQANPDDVSLHEQLAKLLEASGEPTNALPQWERVRELLPHYAAAHFYIGNLLEKAGRRTEAQQSYARAIHLRGEFVEALNAMGMNLVRQSKEDEGQEYLSRALRTNPKYVETYLNLALISVSQRRTNEAIGHLEEAVRVRPDAAVAHFPLANLLVQAGRSAEAIPHYVETVRAQPQNAGAYFSLGNAFASLQRTNEAMASYREAARVKPDFAEARYKLGVLLAIQAKHSEAAAEFTEVLRVSPNYAPAHLNLGTALAQQNQTEQALVHFREALRLNPANKVAQQNIEALQAKGAP